MRLSTILQVLVFCCAWALAGDAVNGRDDLYFRNGSADNLWSNPDNWKRGSCDDNFIGRVPGPGDRAIICRRWGRYCVVDVDAEADVILVEGIAVLEIADEKSLKLYGSASNEPHVVDGTLDLVGSAELIIGDPASGQPDQTVSGEGNINGKGDQAGLRIVGDTTLTSQLRIVGRLRIVGDPGVVTNGEFRNEGRVRAARSDPTPGSIQLAPNTVVTDADDTGGRPRWSIGDHDGVELRFSTETLTLDGRFEFTEPLGLLKIEENVTTTGDFVNLDPFRISISQGRCFCWLGGAQCLPPVGCP